MPRKSIFYVPKMDCSSEENLVRVALNGKDGIKSLEFDLVARELTVVHACSVDQVLTALDPLSLGAALRQSVTATPASQRLKSTFSVPKMDCSSEENLIRMALGDERDVFLNFDLQKRELTAVHEGTADTLMLRLQPLDLGASLVSSVPADGGPELLAPDDDPGEARALKTLLAINGAMFVFEMVLGLVAQSTGLIADSLDMFADAAVYGVALMAVGSAASRKLKAAHFAGWPSSSARLIRLGRGCPPRGVWQRASICPDGGCRFGCLDSECHLPHAHLQEEGRRGAHEGELHLLGQRRHCERGRHSGRCAGGLDRLLHPRPDHRNGDRRRSPEWRASHSEAALGLGAGSLPRASEARTSDGEDMVATTEINYPREPHHEVRENLPTPWASLPRLGTACERLRTWRNGPNRRPAEIAKVPGRNGQGASRG